MLSETSLLCVNTKITTSLRSRVAFSIVSRPKILVAFAILLSSGDIAKIVHAAPLPLDATDTLPATEKESDASLSTKQAQYEDIVIKAFEALTNGNYKQASDTAQDGIDIVQKSLIEDKGARAYFINGLASYRQGKNDEAIKLLKEALRRSPDEQRETINTALKIVIEKNGGKSPTTTIPLPSIWDAQSPLTQHINVSNVVAFSPDGSVLASASWKNVGPAQVSEIVLWDTETGRLRRKMDGRWQSEWSGNGPKPPWVGHWGKVNVLAFSPNGRAIVSGGEDGRTTVWSAITGEPVKILEKVESPIIGISWVNPTSMAIIARNGTVMLVNPINGQKQRTLQLASSATGNWIRACAISNDGTRLATGDSTGRISVWELPTGLLSRRFQNSLYQDMNQPAGVEVTALAFSPDAKVLISANHAHVYLNTVEKLDSNVSAISKIYYGGQRVGQLKFSPDGLTIYAVCETKVDAFAAPDPESPLSSETVASPLIGNGSPIRAIDISPQGSQLGSGSANGAVVLWK